MIDGQTLKFDIEGLHKGVLVMRDRQTDTVWAHLDGTAMTDGPFEGERLTLVPMPQMTWREWRSQHPDTMVLDTDTPYRDRYFSVRAGVDTQASDSLVVGVEVAGEFAAYSIPGLVAEKGVMNGEVAGEPVVVIYEADTAYGAAFMRTVDGQTLTFTRADTEGGSLRLVDGETGSTWHSVGLALDGPMSGKSLEVATSIISEWYGWLAYHPKTDLYLGSG